MLLSLILELAKGFVPVFLGQRFLDTHSLLFIPVLIAPVFGHAFPFFRKEKGGKAITASFGVLLGLFPETDFVEGNYNTGFIAKNGELLQQSITRTSERAENIAMIAAYMDYLMNLEENNSGLAADNRPISKWKEFGLHKG